MQFGPKSRKRIYANLQGFFVEGDQDFFFQPGPEGSDDGNDNDDDDVSSTGDWDFANYNTGVGPSNENGNVQAANNAGNGNGDDDDDDDDNSHSESDELDDDPLIGFAPMYGSTATTHFGTTLADLMATLHDGSPNGSGGTAAQNPNAQPSGPNSTQHGSAIPRVARARLYFAVYQDEIHVFRPQPAPEILRGPLLVLRPPATAAGRELGGHMSKTKPHQANHIITGDLGGVEVIVLAYDDGDVVAYYTRHIVNYLERSKKRRRRKQPGRKVPQPFFRETVGMTAWGLAVHSQSRLIAVSSNLAEVNVFAFALKSPQSDDSLQHITPPLKVPKDDLSPTTYSGFTALELESLLRLRDRHWRILLPLGPSGHNIPCIDFISDANGNAEKVAAVDINGTVKKPKPTPEAHDLTDRNTDSESDTGVSDGKDGKTSRRGAHNKGGENDEDDGSGEDSEDMEDSHDGDDGDYSDDSGTDGGIYMRRRNSPVDNGSYAYNPATMARHWDVLLKRNYQYSMPEGFDLKTVTQTAFRMGMIICPSIGLTWPNLNLPTLLRTLKNARYRLDHSREENLHQALTVSPEAKYMSKRFLILRTYSSTVEIMSTDRNIQPFYIQNVVKPPARRLALWDMERDFHRCSLIRMIPEINLIIVGNMFGRVILIRPLKNNRPCFRAGVPRWAYRVEWTLPLARDEQNGDRPPCCLLGIAASALPEPGSERYGMISEKKHVNPEAPKRYRLILHYMDHTILQYYIDGSKPGDDKLTVHAI
ncbi:hypothetical protein SEUCBS139899_010821 [Sporothrix eucalyptigena]